MLNPVGNKVILTKMVQTTILDHFGPFWSSTAALSIVSHWVTDVGCSNPGLPEGEPLPIEQAPCTVFLNDCAEVL